METFSLPPPPVFPKRFEKGKIITNLPECLAEDSEIAGKSQRVLWQGRKMSLVGKWLLGDALEIRPATGHPGEGTSQDTLFLTGGVSQHWGLDRMVIE